MADTGRYTGLEVKGISELVEEEKEKANAVTHEMEEKDREAQEEILCSSMAGHCKQVFRINRDARRNSGVEQEIIDAGRDVNGEYSMADLARIAQVEQGSDIFMNLPANKSKVLASWIKDILLNATDKAWSFTPTPVQDLPQETKHQIETQVAQEFKVYVEAMQAKKAKAAQPQEGQEGAQQQGQAPATVNASYTLREINQIRRDVQDAILNEIQSEAVYQSKKLEKQVEDQLVEGDWSMALNNFIDNFSVYPTAFMKGPIITPSSRTKWLKGRPIPVTDYRFLNKCPSPLDIYPSPSQTTIEDGDFFEHVRFTRREVHNLLLMPESAGYDRDKVKEILDRNSNSSELGGSPSWLSHVEDEKAENEKRGTSAEANTGVFHGLEGYLSVPAKLIREWGYDSVQLQGIEDEQEMDVEVLLVEEEVVKCKLIKDPFFKRPYYKASFQNIPNSFWGRSLPALMRPNTRICNATARALANNMGISSGPQVDINIDRLADQGAITSMYPWKIWQTKDDIRGGGGRAMNFFQPNSNAKELMEVYNIFEDKADDVTGIPKYAYGNEKTAGAAKTAMGLSLLLESASKGVKNAIRNIDEGLIKPRVEYQFYWNLIKNPDLNFSGDINITPKGSSILTMKAAEQMRRNEFLQITANETDQQIMGIEGRASLLREMSKDLGLTESIIPTRLEIKRDAEQRAEAASAAQQQQMQMEMQKSQIGYKSTERQIQGQENMNQKGLKFKGVELQLDAKKHQDIMAFKVQELRQKAMESQQSTFGTIKRQEMSDRTKLASVNKELAFKLTTGQPGI